MMVAAPSALCVQDSLDRALLLELNFTADSAAQHLRNQIAASTFPPADGASLFIAHHVTAFLFSLKML